MQRTLPVKKMTTAALLIAIGVMIPMLSPVKIVLPPASFTLGSHVPIFLAMFISPAIAAAVAAGTALGFLMGGFSLVIVMRAATHLLFAVVGATILKRNPQIITSPPKALLFNLAIGLLHALAEVLAVTVFYFGGSMNEGYYHSGYFVSVLLLVGVGGVLHSMLDFILAQTIAMGLCRNKAAAEMFVLARPVKKQSS